MWLIKLPVFSNKWGMFFEKPEKELKAYDLFELPHITLYTSDLPELFPGFENKELQVIFLQGNDYFSRITAILSIFFELYYSYKIITDDAFTLIHSAAREFLYRPEIYNDYRIDLYPSFCQKKHYPGFISSTKCLEYIQYMMLSEQSGVILGDYEKICSSLIQVIHEKFPGIPENILQEDFKSLLSIYLL